MARSSRRPFSNAGIDVTVLARGERLDAIKRDSIVIEDALRGSRTSTPVPAIGKLHPEDLYDYILVVVRRNQVAALLPDLAANASPNIVFMTNNPSGSREFVEALGRGRVMSGFVFGAGRKEGQLVRAMRGGGLNTPFGELDGGTSPRLRRLVSILRSAGLKAEASPRIEDFLATHAIGVPLIGLLALKHGCDTKALARARLDLGLFVDAMKESIDVLRSTGHKIVPSSSGWIAHLPRATVVAGFRLLLGSRIGEIGLGWHCSQAPDEIVRLADEVEALVDSAGLPAPAMRSILAARRDFTTEAGRMAKAKA